MASKSSYHREQNTFRFQTFHERLASISIDVARKFGKFTATPEDADTFFAEALEKWTDLNYTQHFVDFRKEISGEVQSLHQLVHHQDEIIKALHKHLRQPGSMAIRPLLDLVVQMARDLQADFYPLFADIFQTLVYLLNTYHHDVETLEQTFTCLAYLFKFLWRHMAKDIDSIFRMFCSLLGAQYKDYIHTFAAESFAFLMRKSKNTSELFEVMFSSLKEDPDMTAGVGRLTFEMIRGVKSQFHSNIEQVLPELLSKLSSKRLPWEEVREAMVTMAQTMTEHTTREHCKVIWDILLGAMANVETSISSSYKQPKVTTQRHLAGLLEIVMVWVQHRNGGLVCRQDELVKMLCALLQAPQLSPECAGLVQRTVTTVITCQHCDLQTQHRPKLVSAVFKGTLSRSLVFEFCRSVFDINLFEKDVLPGLLSYCHQNLQLTDDDSAGRDILHIITSLVQNKAPMAAASTGAHDDALVYPLDFTTVISKSKKTSVRQTFLQWLLRVITDNLAAGCGQMCEPFVWAAVTCLPHVRPMPINQCLPLLDKLCDTLLSSLLCETLQHDSADLASGGQERQLFLLLAAITAVYQLQNNKENFYTKLKPQRLLALTKRFPRHITCLRLVELYIVGAKTHADHLLTDDVFSQLFDVLQQNLSSPHAQVRHLTLTVLCQFEMRLPPLPDDVAAFHRVGVFQICLAAERAEASVHMYRDKLRHLQALSHELVTLQLPEGPFGTVPLRYLLGCLYINFKLLWPPVRALIATHARSLHKDTFWPLLEEFLNNASNNTELQQQKSVTEEEATEDDEKPKNLDLDDLLTSHIEVVTRTDHVDHYNFRHQLWQAMGLFPEVCEPKSRIISPLLFRFLEREFYPTDYTIAPTSDIRKHRGDDEDASLDDSQMDLDQSQDGDDEDVMETSQSEGQQQDSKSESKTEAKSKRRHSIPGASKQPKQRAKRVPNKILVTHLELYAKFTNPVSLHMEPQLKELYFTLLQHKDQGLQEIAFKCVTTYKDKHIIPYKENFERLFDEKTFKNEIVLFSIDESSTVVKEEHRQGLLAVLLRILYGKMQHRHGKDTGGRTQNQLRKGIILRFMAGLTKLEVHMFLDLIMAPFRALMTGSILESVNETMDSVDPAKIIPLRKLQGILTTVDLVQTRLGSLCEAYLPRILHFLLGVASLCTGLSRHRDDISAYGNGLIKKVRNAAFNRIIQFFDNFDFYEFSEEEIEAVFAVCVWPQLDKLSTESLYSPTPLLKLFNVWSEKHKYFPLLGRVHSVTSDLTPLTHTLRLLHAPHVKPAVVTMVMNIVERLLVTEEPEAETEDAEPPPAQPLGTQLILPHVSTVLVYLRTVAKRLEGGSIKKKAVPTRELNILSRLSEHVADGDQATDLIRLLLPFLSRRVNRSQDVEVDVLTTITNLIHKAEQPGEFLLPLASVFSAVTARASRTALCGVLQAIADHAPQAKEIADIVTKLNSWDRRRVEEPDYMVRLQGYDDARALVDITEDVTTMLLVLHNCCFMLSTTDDMSLRDSSSHCLQKLIARIAGLLCEGREDSDSDGPASAHIELLRVVIMKNLLVEIKFKIKHDSETVRHEFTNLLAYLVRTFPTRDPFSALVPLTDATDTEVDFFSNITHIQHHRRGRALRRIAKLLSTAQFSSGVLTNYLLPLTTMFVKDPLYAKSPALHDAALEAFSAICRQLPWPRYLTVLKLYLGNMQRSLDSQKLAVRLVVAVLDAFHFDLKNSKGVRDHLVSNIPEDEGKDKTADDNKTEDEDPETAEDAESPEDPSKEDQQMETLDSDRVDPNTAQVCAEGLATRVHQVIVRIIIPQLHKSLTQKARSEDEHKKSGASKYAEDEEILRVPLALAMVKLLQGLPEGALDRNLSGILIKVCMFLRSRAQDIRDSARDTLAKILQSLGPKYLFYIIKELQSSLTRGYQCHVLCYTVWSLLKQVSTTNVIKTGDLDSCMKMFTAIFNNELFGELSEEKEVEGITRKFYEAKSSKSYDSYGIIAKYVSEESIAVLVVPLKEVLSATTSHKKARKVSEVLHKISLGLVENAGLQLATTLTFVFAVTNETMPQLCVTKEKPSSDKDSAPIGFWPKDSRIIIPEAKRGGHKPKIQTKTNMHIIVDFGLQVLHLLLKKSQLVSSQQAHLELLDPFIKTLTDCLPSKHVKITTTSLRCLSWLLRFPLPALRTHMEAIVSHLFVLLSNYASAGAAQGDNLELMVMCFKVMTVIIRDVTYHTISTSQLQVLLGYAEQDIHDFSRQASAFTLLKAILSRRLFVEEIQEVIRKVQQLSIVSEAPHVRLQCRQVALQYILDYPLGRKLNNHLDFYLRQLEYEHEAGRESALEMLAKVFSDFPQKILTENAGLFFLPLASRLVNDESVRCKKLTSLAIKTLLGKLDPAERDNLLKMCTTWLLKDQPAIQKLAAVAMGIIVEVETTSFERHLGTVLPLLTERIHPDSFTDKGEDSEDRDRDRLLFTMLSLLLRICRECDIIRKAEWSDALTQIYELLEAHLVHPHTWVRTVSARLYGLLLGSWGPAELVETSAIQAPPAEGKPRKKAKKAKTQDEVKSKEAKQSGYLVGGLTERLHVLCGLFCRQLAAPSLDQDLADQVIKNLVFLGKVLRLMPDDKPQSADDVTASTDTGDVTGKKTASLTWLMKRMCREARMEASLNPKNTIKRSSVFKWIAAVALDLGSDVLAYLPTLLQPLLREITDHSANADAELKKLSQEVLELLKSSCSVESFTKSYAAVQTALAQKRDERKRKRATEFVTDPELAAKKKTKKNLAKKEAKKRKIEQKRPVKKLKKQKLSDMAFTDS